MRHSSCCGPAAAPSYYSSNFEEQNYGKKTRVGVEFLDCKIIGDPGLRKLIDSYPYEIRDELRRRYMAKGPTQPCDHKFPQTDFGEIRRPFQNIWFKDFLLGQNHKHSDDILTEVGFKNRKRAKEKFRNHEGSPNSPHSGAVIQLLGFRNQRHNVLVFRGHDESVNSVQREVKQAIVNEIGDKFFSLLVDEAQGSSVEEQLSIVLRFVNDNGEVVKRFLGVLHVSDTSAQTLKNSIDDFFAINGLSISQLRGQGYDGASNMCGELNGLKQKVLDENKHAYYVHYFAHQLQLVLVTTSKKNAFVFDLMVKQMDDCFMESNSELLMCISCLDPRYSFVNFDRNQLLRLSELYSDNFSISDKFELKAQLDTYISYMRSRDGAAFSGLTNIGDLAKKMVETKSYKFFNLVYRLIELA
ncbi:hypothetical protein M9H77_12786 [Catharanthus roseus]|uniref:Uncharacterized protein n=1 Tax=Catharanthus roseus TaxID=4058 RepID=A0ACC0BIG6_CATRO|nr:hypothetical protein M9H77_12786 [Catharanthus roseus]